MKNTRGTQVVSALLKGAALIGAWELSRRAHRRTRVGASAIPNQNIYETLYESQAQTMEDEAAVGGGHFGIFGQIQLDLLRMEGLQPQHTLVDFGCGVGRLAVQAIPYLVGGSYIGVDISETFLKKAERRIDKAVPELPCRVAWVKQTTPHFPFEDHSVDMICAFSVFTHMEHEDTYLYLKDALRFVRPGGRFVFSCLPMNLPYAQEVFRISASVNFEVRWSVVRNVATSVDFMEQIAKMAGWTVVHWYPGDTNNVGLPGGEMRTFGQSSCVLQSPASPSPSA